MKRFIALALLLTVGMVGMAVAGNVTLKRAYPFGNVTGGILRGTAADTIYIPIGLFQNLEWLRFRVAADTVTDSILNATAALGVKPGYVGATWTNVSFATADAGDTVLLEADGSVEDTLVTQTVVLKDLATRGAFYPDSVRVIITGKRAAQCAKACTLEIRFKK